MSRISGRREFIAMSHKNDFFLTITRHQKHYGSVWSVQDLQTNVKDVFYMLEVVQLLNRGANLMF